MKIPKHLLVLFTLLLSFVPAHTPSTINFRSLLCFRPNYDPRKRGICRIYVMMVMAVALVMAVPSGWGLHAQGEFHIAVEVDNAFKLSNLVWSYDNQTLVFLNNGLVENPVGASVDLIQPAWQTYNVETQILSLGQERWPLQPILEPSEIALLQPSNEVLASPDDRLLAYASAEPGKPLQLTFANRASDQFIRTPLDANITPFFLEDGLKGYWSEQGEVFIYPQTNPFTTDITYFHIRVNADVLQETVLTQYSPIVDGAGYVTFDGLIDRYLDMTTNGDRVLAIARKSSSDPYNPTSNSIPYLVVWTPEDNTNSYRILSFNSEDVCDAAFTPSNDGITLLLRDGRVVMYQMATQNILEFPITVTTDCSFFSEFSHNGEWIALTDFVNNQLHFYNIPELITQTPFAIAGSDQTLTDSDVNGSELITLDGSANSDLNETIGTCTGFDECRTAAKITPF